MTATVAFVNLKVDRHSVFVLHFAASGLLAAGAARSTSVVLASVFPLSSSLALKTRCAVSTSSPKSTITSSRLFQSTSSGSRLTRNLCSYTSSPFSSLRMIGKPTITVRHLSLPCGCRSCIRFHISLVSLIFSPPLPRRGTGWLCQHTQLTRLLQFLVLQEYRCVSAG